MQGAESFALRGASRLLTERRISWLFTEFDPLLLRRSHSAHMATAASGMALRVGIDADIGPAVSFLVMLRSHGFQCKIVRAHALMGAWLCNGEASTYGGRACWTDLLCGHSSVSEWKTPGTAAHQNQADWVAGILQSYCKVERFTARRRKIRVVDGCNESLARG